MPNVKLADAIRHGAAVVDRLYHGPNLLWELDSGADVVYPEFVGGRAQGFDGSTSPHTLSLTGLSGGLSSAPQPGDIVIVVWGWHTNAGDKDMVVGPSGWTQIGEQYTVPWQAFNSAMFYKRMGATPDTSCTITNGNSSGGCAAVVHVWRGVDSSSPLDVAAAINTWNAPAITPVTPGAMIVMGVVGQGGTAVMTSPGDIDNFFSSWGNSTLDSNAGIASKPWVSGSYVPPAFNMGGSGSRHGYTIALRPAPV